MAVIHISPPHLTGNEARMAQEALESGWVAPCGPHVDRFESALCDATDRQYALATCSGTAALHLALLAVGVGPGSTVYCPTLSFIATANAIAYTGATPVFIDVTHSTWTMDPELLLDAIGVCVPEAVVVVDIYGQIADYDPIRSICTDYDIPLIVDAAESMGSLYGDEIAGSIGDIATTSFNGNKIITTSSGGALLTNDKLWYDKASHLACQASMGGWHHDAVGYNYRMSNILAAVGLEQLRVLGDRVMARREIHRYYAEHTRKDLFIPECTDRWNRWLTCIRMHPGSVISALAQRGIEARSIFMPLHFQAPYSNCKVFGGDVARVIYRDWVCLPSGSAMTRQQLDSVIDVLKGIGYGDWMLGL